MKFQLPNPKLQTNSNDQTPKEFKGTLRFIHYFEHWNFGHYLTIGIWNLVIHALASRVIALVDLF